MPRVPTPPPPPKLGLRPSRPQHLHQRAEPYTLYLKVALFLNGTYGN